VDEIRRVFWVAFRHLFPPHARAVQTESGSITISWTMEGDPYAQFAHATPITLRFEQDLIETMHAATPEHRKKIAARHEAALRSGMLGYDPYAAVPKARVIVLG
jgi:hypothetical protein